MELNKCCWTDVKGHNTSFLVRAYTEMLTSIIGIIMIANIPFPLSINKCLIGVCEGAGEGGGGLHLT